MAKKKREILLATGSNEFGVGGFFEFRNAPKNVKFSLDGEPFTKEVVKDRDPTMLGYAKALMLSILALVVGTVLFKLASKIWVMIFGRLSDPVWRR